MTRLSMLVFCYLCTIKVNPEYFRDVYLFSVKLTRTLSGLACSVDLCDIKRGHPYVPRVLCSLFLPKRVPYGPMVAIHTGEHRTLFAWHKPSLI